MTKTSPLQLVREESGGRYVVCDEGARFLSELRSGLPLAVVVVAGKYRTGKSFLLNRGVLALTQRQGFSTCGSVQACTKGVWIYPALQYGEGHAPFLVVDTEGTSSTVASADQDARLVGISLALASIFVYNSHGTVDETALSELASLTSVASAIAREEEEGGGQARWTPPQLVWALRDFTLQLFDAEGREVTSDAYLEAALEDTSNGKADMRAALRSYFPVRKLFTLVRPCNSEVDLQRLNTLANSALRSEFRQQLDVFRAHVRAAARNPKEVGGIGLDGPALLRLLQAAVEATNAGRAPSVRSTFDFLLQQRASVALEEGLEELRAAAERVGSELPRPPPLRLEVPPPPSFLQPLEEARGRYERVLSEERARLLAALEERNARAGAELARAVLEAAAGGSGDFDAGLRQLVERLGAACAVAHAPALHLELRAAAETSLALAKAEVQASAKDAEATAQELRRLRDELDEAVLRSLQPAPLVDEAALQEQRSTFQSEMNAMAAERDAHEVRTRELRWELETALSQHSTRAEEALEAEALRAQLAEAQQEHAAARLGAQERVELERARHAEDLDALKASYHQVLAQVEGRARTAEERRKEAADRTEDAELRALRAEEGADRERKVLEDRRRQLHAEAEEQRRAASLSLAQKAQIMKEAHEALITESGKARERAAASERKLMTLEVQADSLKRRLDIALQDGDELAKLRRLHEEQRCRLGALEIAMERSTTALEAEKRERRRIEEDLRVVEMRSLDEKRSSSLRIANLEMELQSYGAPLSKF